MDHAMEKFQLAVKEGIKQMVEEENEEEVYKNCPKCGRPMSVR
jgi:hypothetical protein